MISHYVAAIPCLSYGHGNGTPMTENEMRTRLKDINAPHWKRNYPSANNLAAYLKLVNLGWDLCDTATKQKLSLLYNEQHAAPQEHVPIGHLPWGKLAELPCSRANTTEGCNRCTNIEGGFAFGWIGPWSCTRCLQDHMRPHEMKSLWQFCNYNGGCEACKLMASLESWSDTRTNQQPTTTGSIPATVPEPLTGIATISLLWTPPQPEAATNSNSE